MTPTKDQLAIANLFHAVASFGEQDELYDHAKHSDASIYDLMKHFLDRALGAEETAEYLAMTPENARDALAEKGWFVPDYVDFSGFMPGSWTAEVSEYTSRDRRSVQAKNFVMHFETKRVRTSEYCTS